MCTLGPISCSYGPLSGSIIGHSDSSSSSARIAEDFWYLPQKWRKRLVQQMDFQIRKFPAACFKNVEAAPVICQHPGG